ncbi:type-2 angiotensin II receptor [Electrophorus electricus]|uniref:G-protein coupled receptors family 1 profile domain-containing protein n=1 Tax=Electrophorus electricus TaxID=8005 RepID=A0AAY5F5M8_ELEEL|nr:type-2 angiotensin II receptor [Electrophorus electricus]XP_035382681.1 type-2 angiotensin II receptor [Electrophorus electricus]XP_035382682.1 type-2 angiotensin II receptor [Electrophorus electricus]
METDPSLNFTMLNESSLHSPASKESCDYLSPSVSQYQRRFVPVLYAAIFLLGFLGNALVVGVLCCSPSHRTASGTYLVNLAASDLLFLGSLPFWASYYSMEYEWVFGRAMCKLCGALLSFNVYASIFFITCMSADRYQAVVHPLRSPYRARRVGHARRLCAGVWALAAVSTLPTLAFRDVVSLQGLNVTACAMTYPDQRWHTALTLAKNTVGFLVPFVVIATCYGRIAGRLLATPRLPLRGSARPDHVLRMVVAVVTAFFLCWCPFHVLAFLGALRDLGVEWRCEVGRAVGMLLPASLCLGFSNSAINPFLYCFVGNRFREQLRGLYRQKVTHVTLETLSTRLTSFSRKLSSDVRDSATVESLPPNNDL